jgi:hypothetical protein
MDTRPGVGAAPAVPSGNAEDVEMPGARPATGANDPDEEDIDWAAVEAALAAAAHLQQPRQVDGEMLDLASVADSEEENLEPEDEELEGEGDKEDDLEAGFWDDVFNAEMDLEIDDDGTYKPFTAPWTCD